MKNICITLSFLIILLSSWQANADSKGFTKSNFEQVKQQHIGKKWLMLLWSIDCPACFKEIALIEKIREQQHNINLVIINTDDNDEVAEEREKILSSYNLSSLPNYHFMEGTADMSRYTIDKSWYGELPRSYFIDETGKFHGKSGLVSPALLKMWLLTDTLGD